MCLSYLYIVSLNSVQTRCIVKGEAQKSPLFWRFSGGFWFSQDRLLSRNSTRNPLNLKKKNPRFLQAPLVFTMRLAIMHIVDYFVVILRNWVCDNWVCDNWVHDSSQEWAEKLQLADWWCYWEIPPLYLCEGDGLFWVDGRAGLHLFLRVLLGSGLRWWGRTRISPHIGKLCMGSVQMGSEQNSLLLQ